MSIVERESDAVSRHGSNCPVLLVIAHETTVKSILTAVLVLWNVRGLAIDCERAVLDPARRSASHAESV